MPTTRQAGSRLQQAKAHKHMGGANTRVSLTLGHLSGKVLPEGLLY